MRNLSTIFICFLLSICTLSMDSCKKEKIEGCMDPDSKNYNSLAEKDDGSCRYEGKVVVWFNQTTSYFLMNDDANVLTYYINGEIVGSSATDIYWTGAPTCGQNGSITITKDLGKLKTQAYTLSVKDQTGWEYWNTVVNFNANTCYKLQLTSSNKKK